MIWNPFKRKAKNAQTEDDDFEALWNERLAILEGLYGKSDNMVGHANVPFYLGYDIGGAADIVYFSSHISGKLSVTAELIGCELNGSEPQKRNPLGSYELAIAHRSADESWGPNIISRLAYYTLDTPMKPKETMDLGPLTPDGSTIDALLFFDYGRFIFRGKKAGVLLCMGITEREKNACFAGKKAALIEALKTEGIFPYTDLTRKSVI
ncbi:MAG TPA: hypothetical protein ENL03_01530 [Phycisphaerae bacterium]|nr:hypothetical protein [Phycisphaerae bacterium]